VAVLGYCRTETSLSTSTLMAPPDGKAKMSCLPDLVTLCVRLNSGGSGPSVNMTFTLRVIVGC